MPWSNSTKRSAHALAWLGERLSAGVRVTGNGIAAVGRYGQRRFLDLMERINER